MLHAMGKEWSMEFAQGGVAALELLEMHPVDILVTDMRMPGMDGAELLAKVREGWPQTTRIVLSGHSEHEAVIRSLNDAHQYLMKPCDQEVLKKTVARALRLRRLIGNPSLRSLLSRLNHIPSLPSLYLEINAALANKDTSVRDIGEIVTRDVSFSIKLLQLVNSAFFGLPRSIATPVEAAVLLGTDLIRTLVLGTKVFSSLEHGVPLAQGIEALWRHSLRTALLARDLATKLQLDRKDADGAFLAGFVHDIGRLVLQANLPQESKQCAALTAQGMSEREAETRIFGATHEVVSAWLLGTWGLPDASVEAVAFIHTPSEAPGQSIGTLTAVHLADAFDEEVRPMSLGRSPLDEQYVARLGLTEQVARWRADHATTAMAETPS